MNRILEIVALVCEINNKFSSEDICARVHLTRHTIKVEVFFSDPSLKVDRFTGRVHYINQEKQAQKLINVESQLKSILESGKL